MSALKPKITADQPVIRQLDEAAINRIAAGEVIERPASAIKELVENALDADARRIEIVYADGGKTLLRVTDDGCGIAEVDLPLALSRHATSKIDGSNLLDITSFGFRGEALPSLGAVGRLKIISRARGSDAGAEISVAGGTNSAIKPAALGQGTIVTLRDLFSATPARLKFLRSDRAEATAILDVVKRLAMAEPFVGFTLRDVSGGGEGRVVFRADPEIGDLFDALYRRLAAVLGREFIENALKIEASRDGLTLTGYAALPTYSRGAAVAQFLFVNGRPVRDKLLVGALRGAYMDFLSRDRHPVACLFIDCPPHLVDVNVHPAKAEVRFRDPGMLRGLIITALRHALAGAGHRASNTVATATLGAMQPERLAPRVYQMDLAPRMRSFAEPAQVFEPSARVEAPVYAASAEAVSEPTGTPLGAARAQVHENYIIAQTDTGIVIVDQHAAHERLIYERLKRQMAENGVAAQALLIPEIITLSEEEAQLLLAHAAALSQYGLCLEPFGQATIAVRETPAILGTVNAEAMLRDILDELHELGASATLQSRVDALLSRMACHGSIRSGRRMQADEMNALLREMETTPHSGQCNHGRPTYVSLDLNDIERLFGRK